MLRNVVLISAAFRTFKSISLHTLKTKGSQTKVIGHSLCGFHFAITPNTSRHQTLHFEFQTHIILKEEIDQRDNESSNEKSCQGTSEEIANGSTKQNKHNRILPSTKFVHMRMTISGVLKMSIDFSILLMTAHRR